MRLVILESPYAGNVERNVAYARQCIKDCLRRGESPIASHLLYTQRGILDDGKSDERKLGIAAGHSWVPVADAIVVYTDRGVTTGMEQGIKEAQRWEVPVEYRSLAISGEG